MPTPRARRMANLKTAASVLLALVAVGLLWWWTWSQISATNKRVIEIIHIHQGPQGERGATGPRGRVGAKGPRGHQGAQGRTGHRGAVGPVGPRGRRGVQGRTGARGQRGVRGFIGPRGLRGLTGPVGPRGPAGVTTCPSDYHWAVISIPGLKPAVLVCERN